MGYSLIRQTCVLFALLSVWNSNGVLGQDAKSLSSPDLILRWVRELDSNRYIERRQATEKLIEAGQASIEPVVRAVQEGSLETVARGLHILAELASSGEYETESAACDALEQLVAKKGTVISRRAAAMLADIGPIRYERAKAYLQSKGAVIGLTKVQSSMRIAQTLPSVAFGETWSGSIEDLSRLRMLLDHAQASPYEEGANWLLSFEGPRFSDDWLKGISSLTNVVAVKIRKTSVTEAGIAHLRELKRLRFLDILYNPLPATAIEQLSLLSSPLRMRLYGTKLEKDAIEQLRAALPGSEIDDRLGGFLGVSCADFEPCKVSFVGVGTAAKNAGIQEEDVIVSYNGQPVASFEVLTQLIGRNQPGDEVSVEIRRLGELITLKVTLGECLE